MIQMKITMRSIIICRRRNVHPQLKKNHNGACQKVCDNVDFRRWKNDQSVPAQKNCTLIKFFPSTLNIS